MAFEAGPTQRPPVIETLAKNKNVKIDRVRALGQITPPGEFPDEPGFEFILLLTGKLVLEFQGQAKKVTLEPGDYAVKAPAQRSRADFTALDEETVWLKVSWRDGPGRFPLFTGALGASEIHPKKASRKARGS